MVSLVDTWIKASVERRILIIDYFDRGIKKEFLQEEVEPQYVGFSQNGGKKGLFGVLRNKGPVVFETNDIIRYNLSNSTFIPVEHAKRKQVEMVYNRKSLKYKK